MESLERREVQRFMMPLFIRMFTGVLVVGGVAGVVWASNLLVGVFVGMWTLAFAYVGLALAAYWETPNER